MKNGTIPFSTEVKERFNVLEQPNYVVDLINFHNAKNYQALKTRY